MATTNKIGVPTGYKGCIILPVGAGFDVVDRTSGRWMHDLHLMAQAMVSAAGIIAKMDKPEELTGVNT